MANYNNSVMCTAPLGINPDSLQLLSTISCQITMMWWTNHQLFHQEHFQLNSLFGQSHKQMAAYLLVMWRLMIFLVITPFRYSRCLFHQLTKRQSAVNLIQERNHSQKSLLLKIHPLIVHFLYNTNKHILRTWCSITKYVIVKSD